MNIALFSEMERVDGQGRYWMLHARWLAENGHRVVLFSPESAALEGLGSERVIHVPINSVRQAIPLQYEDIVADTARLVRACDEFGVEAMVATAKLPFVMAEAALGERLPIFVPILSDTYFLPKTPFALAAIRNAAAAGRVFTSSEDVAAAIGSEFGFSPDDVRYYPFPMDAKLEKPQRAAADVRAELGVADTEIFVLTISRLDIDKAPSIPHLASAVDALTRAGYPTRLVVVGDGTLAQQVRAACSARTIFTGNRYDLADLYHACDVYVGEGTTILEAAIARRPVIVSGASWHRDSPEKVFAIFGVHMFDHGFHAWNNFSPPTSYLDALLPFVTDPELRERVGAAGYDLVKSYNHVDVVLPWFVEYLPGRNVNSMGFHEHASAVISVPGGLRDGIDAIGSLCARVGDVLKIGIAFTEPVPFERVLAMPIAHAQALARAVRRHSVQSTPHAHFDGAVVPDSRAFPCEIIDAARGIDEALPPTSVSPRFSLGKRDEALHLVAASEEERALEMLAKLDANGTNGGTTIVWIPLEDPAKRHGLAERLRAATRRSIALLPEPVAWTLVGRLLGAISTYADDGSTTFARHRRYVAERGVTPVELPKNS